MSEYRPDVWVVLRIKAQGETVEKVLAGWHGGFADPDVWRLNSGITRVEQDGDHYRIHGYSGSVYFVHASTQRMNMLTASIYDQIKSRAEDEGGTVEVIDVKELICH